MTRRGTGIALAFVTALVSGVSIYLNGHAVKHFADATAYTTAKDAVAGILLLSLALVRRPAAEGRTRRPVARRAIALLLVAVVGGSVPFVLFFEGLARAQATQAAFIQKTLVVWVALLAVPVLGERFRRPHALAVCLLVGGQLIILGRAGTVAFGGGETMILAATLLWSIEVVYVKRALAWIAPRTLAAARMALGTLLLVAWLALDGGLGALASYGGTQWRWVVLTGLLLTAYVATWYAALARAQAIDVTAVLVFGAVVTAFLSAAEDGAAVSVPGIALVALGTAVVALAALRSPTRAAA